MCQRNGKFEGSLVRRNCYYILFVIERTEIGKIKLYCHLFANTYICISSGDWSGLQAWGKKIGLIAITSSRKQIAQKHLENIFEKYLCICVTIFLVDCNYL